MVAWMAPEVAPASPQLCPEWKIQAQDEEQRDECGVQGEGAHEAAAELLAVGGDVEGAGCELGLHGLREKFGPERFPQGLKPHQTCCRIAAG